jgi:hypothetical protein
MGKRDLRVDAYIAKSADFAKPILVHLREVVHEACPDIEESINGKTAYRIRPVQSRRETARPSFRRSWRARSRRIREQPRHLKDFRQATNASMRSGSPTRSETRRASAVSIPRSSGWPKENRGTGSTKSGKPQGGAARHMRAMETEVYFYPFHEEKS